MDRSGNHLVKNVKFPKNLTFLLLDGQRALIFLVILNNLLWLLSVTLMVEECQFITYFNFSTLYTKIPQYKLSKPLNKLINS